MVRSLAIAVAGLALGALSGCPKPATGTATVATTAPTYAPGLCETDGRHVEPIDRDANGATDGWNIYQDVSTAGATTRVLTCHQQDLNKDGVVDHFESFDIDGHLLADGFDFTFDGQLDVRRYYRDDEVVRVERDLDGDGQPDVTETYADGKPVASEHDRNGDGRADMWDLYEDGELAIIRYDDDFDGELDRMESLEPKPPAD